MLSNNYSLPIQLFALVSFVSIAAGNAVLGLATLFFVVYVFKHRELLRTAADFRPYYVVLACFLLTMLVSALGSGAVGKGLRVWADLWVWRLMPFVIITLTIRKAVTAKRILAIACLGITLGACCLIYQGLGGAHRAAGFFGHPMTFAGYFCIYLPVLLICFLEREIFGRWRWAAGLAFFLGLAGLLFNGTRGAWLALAPLLLVVLCYYIYRKNVLAIACLAVLLCCGVGLRHYEPFMQRLATITDSRFQSNTERLLIWGSAYKMFRDHPVLGVGLGQYKDSYQQKYISPKAKEPLLGHAHNNFLQMLAENGVIGFAGFVILLAGFIGYSLLLFWRTQSAYALMAAASTLALLLQGLTEYNFGNSAVMKSFWLVQGCLLQLELWQRQGEKQEA